uniref:Uncharacterized protein n=1 Tax=Anguilla anguilla TaxID=7936 RepID=A0A0E9R4D4_ANGAN
MRTSCNFSQRVGLTYLSLENIIFTLHLGFVLFIIYVILFISLYRLPFFSSQIWNWPLCLECSQHCMKNAAAEEHALQVHLPASL